MRRVSAEHVLITSLFKSGSAAAGVCVCVCVIDVESVFFSLQNLVSVFYQFPTSNVTI